MLTLLAAAMAVKLAYSFPPDVKRVYDVQTVFEGFIPVLGGREAKLEVQLLISAKGLKPAEDGNPQVLSNLEDFKLILNGAPLSLLTIENAREYFPPTTITTTPFGATLKTNAPDIQLPVKLPGLDIKRFPDITYLPLQLPEGEAEVGKPYTFKRAFGDSDISYTVTPTKITDEAVEMDVALVQNYELMENEGLEVVKDQKEAISRVKTDMAGKGTATFDRRNGIFTKVHVVADATSVVTDLATSKKQGERKLKTTLNIKLKK